jgi:hypothetical protein
LIRKPVTIEITLLGNRAGDSRLDAHRDLLLRKLWHRDTPFLIVQHRLPAHCRQSIETKPLNRSYVVLARAPTSAAPRARLAPCTAEPGEVTLAPLSLPLLAIE